MIGTTYSARLASLTQASGRLSEQISVAQEQAVTGLQISRPSDAPDQVATLHRLSEQLDDQAIWNQNAESAMSGLDAADAALDSMSDVISAARALAVQFSSDTTGAEDMARAATQAQGYLDQLVGLANTEFDGRYLFAGTAYDQPAFDDTGTYLGTTDAPGSRVGDDQEVATGFDGGSLLQGDEDVFDAVASLVSALEAGDHDAVAEALDRLDAAQDQISDARTQVGLEYATAEDAVVLTGNMEVLLSEAISNKAEADPTATYTRLAELQTTYEAVLQITAASQVSNLFSMM